MGQGMGFLHRSGHTVAVAVAVILCAQTHAQASDPVSISYEPVWQGLGRELSTVPIRLVLENAGKPESIGIRWSDGNTEVSTRVDLATGVKKERVLYLTRASGYEPLELQIRRGIIESPLSVEPNSSANFDAIKVGIISDSLGDAVLFKPDQESQFKNKAWSSGFAAGVAKPGRAPIRTSAYDDLRILILGEGAERLTDDEVTAIQLSILRGLHVVFAGGSIRPVLSDVRWDGFLPVEPGGPVKTVTPPDAYRKHSNKPAPTGPMLDLQPVAVAETVASQGVAVQSTLAVGAGHVTFLAFDPFSRPWRTWNGRFALVYSLAQAESAHVWNTLRASVGRPVTQPGHSAYSSSLDQPVQGGLFGLKIPEPSRITLLLTGYLILVVPVNFLVLRKLRKGEWAWLTAPLIALGAAGILFGFAGQLYSSKASRQTRGFLVASDSGGPALFVGTQQIFFPGNGRYDLKMEGVQKVSAAGYAETNFFGQRQIQNRFIDMGTLSAPAFEVDNLSFREFDLEQSVSIPNGWIQSRPVAKGDQIEITVTNPLKTELSEAQIVLNGSTLALGTIPPGQKMTRAVAITGPGGIAVLTANVSGNPFGARFGTEVGGNGVQLSYSFTIEGKQ